MEYYFLILVYYTYISILPNYFIKDDLFINGVITYKHDYIFISIRLMVNKDLFSVAQHKLKKKPSLSYRHY
jgi:hypothetical protein